MLIHCNDNNFEEELLENEGNVLVDFYADWCGPCQMLAPLIEDISKEHNVIKVNVDEAPETARKYGIMSIPTLIAFNKGEIVDQIVGLAPVDKILEMLNK